MYPQVHTKNNFYKGNMLDLMVSSSAISGCTCKTTDIFEMQGLKRMFIPGSRPIFPIICYVFSGKKKTKFPFKFQYSNIAPESYLSYYPFFTPC